jgi:hypothetical protein
MALVGGPMSHSARGNDPHESLRNNEAIMVRHCAALKRSA